jgi:hypothetical protein
MPYEERRVVSTDPVDPVPVEKEVVRTTPDTYVEQRPVHRTVVSDDPIGNAYAASQLIQTIVWSVVVIVLLVVALVALHVYAGLF